MMLSKKRGRPAAVPEAVSQDEFNRVKANCEDYRSAMERIKEYEMDMLRVNELLAAASTPFEKELYSQDLEKMQQELEADTEMTSLIRWGLSQLESKTRNILHQLYIDGYVWQDIQREDGTPLGSGSIQHEKNKGLRLLAIALRKKRPGIWARK